MSFFLTQYRRVWSKREWALAGQRFVPGSACFSGRQLHWQPSTPPHGRLSYQHKRQRQCQASSRPQSLQVVSASEGEGAVQSLAEDGWIARVLAAFASTGPVPAG